MAEESKSKSRGDGISTIESGDIYFAYRSKVQQESAEGLEDVQRMHVVLRPKGEKRYRLLVIGEKKISLMSWV